MNDTNDKSNITIGLPKDSGAIFWAPSGSVLPSSANEALSNSYKNLGYATDDGVTFSKEESANAIEAWGRDKVMVTSEGYSEKATFNLLETTRKAVLDFIYGSGNVVIDEETGEIKVASTGEPLPRGVLVIDTIQNNGSATPKIHRIVLGDCQFTDRSGDQSYNNADPLNFPVSVEAFKFDSKAVSGKKVYHDDFWASLGSSSDEG